MASASIVLVSLIGLLAGAAVAAGIASHRPPRRLPWVMVGAALVLEAAARAVYTGLPGQPGTLKPYVWIVWAMHMAMTILLVLATVDLVGSRRLRASTVIDTLVIVLSGGLLFTLLIAIPYAGAPGIGALWESARVGYVARDVVVLALAAYVGLSLRRNPSNVLFRAGLVTFVLYDVLFRLGRIRGEWLAGTPLDLIWLSSFAMLGGAALVGSMADFTGAVSARNAPRPGDEPGTRIRLGLVAVAALMPSAVLAVGLLRRPAWNQGLLVATASAVLLLTLARVLDVTAELRHQVRGEQVIREAVTGLADAHDASVIGTVIDRAVGRLLRPRSGYRTALAPPLDKAGRPAGPGPLGAWVSGRYPPVLDTSPAARRSVLAFSTAPNPGALGRVGGPCNAGYAGPDPGGEPWMFVSGDRRSLRRARRQLATLATQVGLALQRLHLNDQLMRHNREAYFRTLVQKTTDIILIVDDDNRIRYATPSSASLVGARPVIGEPLLDFVDPADRPEALSLLESVRHGPPDTTMIIRRGSDDTGPGDWVVQYDGEPPARVEVTGRNLRADPSIGGLVFTLRNVTDQRRLESELADRALRDPLTGLSNRVLFTDRVEAALREQAATDTIAGVMYIDLDDLKMINDSLGHEAGDAVLTAVAARLARFVGGRDGSPTDAASRLGGDEFAVLLTDLPDEKTLDLAADALIDELARPVAIGAHEAACTASIGTATTREPTTAQGLLRDADLALYAAKGSGKRQWRRFEPWMRSSLVARLALRSSLAEALDNNEFFLEYQPIVRLADRSTVGFEALLRWQHPTRGCLGPAQFIDVAEESGLITPIGKWVAATAFSAACRWRDQVTGVAPYVGINVSVRQFHGRDFVNSFLRLLTESGLPATQVLVEITESLLLRRNGGAWHDLRRLRDAGVGIAIDDFGTGYSALSYLRDVPLDVVKLDRSFIAPLDGSTSQREFVAGIVALAKTLDLNVIAEGIETERECAAAADSGCRYGQGFLFSRPLPEKQVARWLADHAQTVVR